MSQTLIIISTILVLISPILYIRSIWKWETKPHRTTRIVYLVISILSTYALYMQHDTVGIRLSAATLVQSLAVFLLSMRYGVGGWSKEDIICLAIAVAGIIVRKITNNPFTAVAASILADVAGTRPTLIKTRSRPESETRTYYGIDTIAWALSLLALSGLSLTWWTIESAAYPWYIFLINLVMVWICLRKKLTHVTPSTISSTPHE